MQALGYPQLLSEGSVRWERNRQFIAVVLPAWIFTENARAVLPPLTPAFLVRHSISLFASLSLKTRVFLFFFEALL